MTDDKNENENTMSGIETSGFNLIMARIDSLSAAINNLEIQMVAAQHEHTQTLRTVMVGWNAFLKNAEAQLRGLFKGNIPAPIMKKLIQTAFKGMEDMERKGK